MTRIFADNYVSAVKQILNGHYIENLEELRLKYNKSFEGHSTNRWYNTNMILLSFAANAENKILESSSPDDAYGSIKSVNPETFRRVARNTLEEFVRNK